MHLLILGAQKYERRRAAARLQEEVKEEEDDGDTGGHGGGPPPPSSLSVDEEEGRGVAEHEGERKLAGDGLENAIAVLCVIAKCVE